MRAKTGWVWTTALLVVGATMLTAERTAAAEVDTPLQSAKLPKSVGAVVAASNKFGAALVGRLVKPSAGRTVVLSPYGVGTALSMLALGAEGGTRTVLHNGLGHAHLTAEQVIGQVLLQLRDLVERVGRLERIAHIRPADSTPGAPRA